MQQIQFVGEDHLDVITSMVANTRHFDAAVAYWRKGSITALDLKRAPAGSTLVCNLFSPNCDANEVETLFRLKRFNLKRHDGLHAKVYLADDAVCVGSLTALNTKLRSVKDLPFPQREANLICRDPAVIGDVRTWIDKIIAESKPIEKQDIDEAKQRWCQEREGLAPELIDLKEEAIKKAKLVVLVWAGEPSEQVKKQVKKFPEHSLPRHDWFIDLPEHATGYPYGSHAICFKLSDDRRRLGKCEGIFEILTSSNPYQVKNAGRREVVIWRLRAVESRPFAIVRFRKKPVQFAFGKRSVDAIRNKVIERERGLKLKSVFDSGEYGFLSWEPLHTLLRTRAPVASS